MDNQTPSMSPFERHVDPMGIAHNDLDFYIAPSVVILDLLQEKTISQLGGKRGKRGGKRIKDWIPTGKEKKQQLALRNLLGMEPEPTKPAKRYATMLRAERAKS